MRVLQRDPAGEMCNKSVGRRDAHCARQRTGSRWHTHLRVRAGSDLYSRLLSGPPAAAELEDGMVGRRISKRPGWPGGTRRIRTTACAALGLAIACSSADPEPPAAPLGPPNILWVLWDTVRADRLSLYGYQKSTTPHLDAWASKARVFEDAVSTSSSTLPSHASMFTGLMPSEHGTTSEHRRLDDRHRTIAELFRDAGYRTYLWSSNPYVSSPHNFDQGFEFDQHPWSPPQRKRATELYRSKLSRTSDGTPRNGDQRAPRWSLTAAGDLVQPNLEAWLDRSDGSKPFFAFVNYMEAHWPSTPPRKHRERMMPPEHIEASYRAAPDWYGRWSHSFGLSELDPPALAVMASSYDATLAELDELFHNLLRGLEEKGALENTVVVLTADHGEHLGEHHLLDHQFSVYQPVLHVPLVVHYPARFSAGRDSRPVMNFDLFPTLLELAGIAPPQGLDSKARSLLHPQESRSRLVEYPAPFAQAFNIIRQQLPDWDDTAWRKRIRAVYEGNFKLIVDDNGNSELYDLERDPSEQNDRSGAVPAVAERLAARMQTLVDELRIGVGAAAPEQPPRIMDEHLERLRALGYEASGEPDE